MSGTYYYSRKEAEITPGLSRPEAEKLFEEQCKKVDTVKHSGVKLMGNNGRCLKHYRHGDNKV